MGQYLDNYIELYYLRARYYQPGTGRFVTPDPFPGMTVNPATLRPYLYALDNPVRYTDPSGEFFPDWIVDVVGIGLDVADVVQNPRSWQSWAALGADVVLGVLPVNRAEHYHRTGELRAFEFVEGANRYDMVLDTGTVVEVKYWTQGYAGQNLRSLVDQTEKYRASGRELVVELVATKTDPITEDFVDALFSALQRGNVKIPRRNVRIAYLD